MFFNELVINEEIAKSDFTSNFSKLFASGYWNGLTSHPMHIFEYLGKEITKEKWDENKVYEVIGLRLKELHLLGISHTDVRRSNIHISESGKVTLIDFGLSKYPCSEASKQGDLESLDSIFGVTSKKEVAKSLVAVNDKADTDHSDEDDANTSSEVELAEMSFKSHDTKTTTTTK